MAMNVDSPKVGYLGGIVALEAALRVPSALAGLVLYEPPVAVKEPLGGEAVARAKAALARGDASAAMAIHLRDVVRLSWPTVMLARLWPQTWQTARPGVRAAVAPGYTVRTMPQPRPRGP